MVDSINQLRAQYTQLQNTYNSMTGNRGLGTLLNSPVDQPRAATSPRWARRSTPWPGARCRPTQRCSRKWRRFALGSRRCLPAACQPVQMH
jgi:hypothetical protein